MANSTRNSVKGDKDSQAIAALRREQIVSAAVALFAKRGYFQTTIEDISNKINVGKGLIYRYFKDKNDVLFYALCSVLEEYERVDVETFIAESRPLAALIEGLSASCFIAHEHTQEMALAYRSTKDLLPEQATRIKEIESGIVERTRRCIEECVRHGLMMATNADILAYQIVMFGHTWALKHWALREKFSVEEYVAEGEKLLILPFLTQDGRAEFIKIVDAAVPPAGKVARRK